MYAIRDTRFERFAQMMIFVEMRRFKSEPPAAPLEFASASGRKRFGSGCGFGEAGSPSTVLSDDFWEGSTGGMTDGREKKKGFHDSIGLDWGNRSISDLSYFRFTPVGSDWR